MKRRVKRLSLYYLARPLYLPTFSDLQADSAVHLSQGRRMRQGVDFVQALL
jgi:hypothetical protein